MSIMAMFQGFNCPACGMYVVVSQIRTLREPGLAIQECPACKRKYQIIDDPLQSCRFRVEALKIS
jgi:Zn ribbon nucleic-acid-binding protein